MTDSLEEAFDAFQGIEWRNVYRLVRLIAASENALSQIVASRYREQATRIDETKAFLVAIGVIRECACCLVVVGPIAAVARDGTESSVGTLLLAHIMGNDTRFRAEICHYLEKFKLVNGDAIYCPHARLRGQQSSVRNFLIDIGVLGHSKDGLRYEVLPDYLHIYASLKMRSKPVSPHVLEQNLRARRSIGLAAEKYVLLYEKKRLGPAYAHLVDHVALRNVAAGYDIRSASVMDDATVIPRYIEVKAVSDATLSFYWSASEIAMARLLGSKYYLYLLPVLEHGHFKVECLRTIQDPQIAVLGCDSDWLIREDVIRCSLKEENWDGI